MAEYDPRTDPMTRVMFWCSHRDFTNGTDVVEGDCVLQLTPSAYMVLCDDCLINLGNLLLKNGTYLGGADEPIAFYCEHREWSNGSPGEGVDDHTFELLKDADVFLVGCDECAAKLAKRLVVKAVHNVLADIKTLEDMLY